MGVQRAARSRAARLAGAAVAIGGAAIVGAPFLPWVRGEAPLLGTASMTGLDAGRGVPVAIAAGIAAVVAGIVLVGGRGPWRAAVVVGAVAGIASGAVGWIALRDAADPMISLLVSRDDAPVTYSPALGVWLLFAGAGFALAGSVASGAVAMRRRQPEQRPSGDRVEVRDPGATGRPERSRR